MLIAVSIQSVLHLYVFLRWKYYNQLRNNLARRICSNLHCNDENVAYNFRYNYISSFIFGTIGIYFVLHYLNYSPISSIKNTYTIMAFASFICFYYNILFISSLYKIIIMTDEKIIVASDNKGITLDIDISSITKIERRIYLFKEIGDLVLINTVQGKRYRIRSINDNAYEKLKSISNK